MYLKSSCGIKKGDMLTYEVLYYSTVRPLSWLLTKYKQLSSLFFSIMYCSVTKRRHKYSKNPITWLYYSPVGGVKHYSPPDPEHFDIEESESSCSHVQTFQSYHPILQILRSNERKSNHLTLPGSSFFAAGLSAAFLLFKIGVL